MGFGLLLGQKETFEEYSGSILCVEKAISQFIKITDDENNCSLQPHYKSSLRFGFYGNLVIFF